MPAVSKAQQRFMGMVHAAQKGEKPASAAVAKAADTISDKDAEDYASTKHDGLPDKVDESGAMAGKAVGEFLVHVYKICTQSGMHPIYAVIVSLISTIGVSVSAIATFFGIINFNDIVDNVKEMYSDFKARRKVSPQQIKAVGDEFLSKVNKIKEPGRRKYFLGLINKMKRTDPTDKQAVVNIQKDITKYADAYVKNENLFTSLQGMKTAINYAPTKHDGEPDYIPQMKEIIRKMVREIMTQKTLEEMNVTGNVQGYQTPYAFTKKGGEKKKAKRQADLTGYTAVNENRWLELKKEETPPHAKIGRGIANINKQLAEMERFLNWYGRIKQESGITNEQFWKRTNHNIYKIKERLIKLEQKVRKIAQ